MVSQCLSQRELQSVHEWYLHPRMKGSVISRSEPVCFGRQHYIRTSAGCGSVICLVINTKSFFECGCSGGVQENADEKRYTSVTGQLGSPRMQWIGWMHARWSEVRRKCVRRSSINDRRDRSIKESPGTSKDNLQRPIENAVSA
jgi:hypothetical protein